MAKHGRHKIDGPKPTHGITGWQSRGRWPNKWRNHRRRITHFHRSLVEQYGGAAGVAGMTAAETAMVERAVVKYGILVLADRFIAEKNMLSNVGGFLTHPFGQRYLEWNRSFERSMEQLGIHFRPPAPAFDADAIVIEPESGSVAVEPAVVEPVDVDAVDVEPLADVVVSAADQMAVEPAVVVEPVGQVTHHRVDPETVGGVAVETVPAGVQRPCGGVINGDVAVDGHRPVKTPQIANGGEIDDGGIFNDDDGGA